MSNFDHYVGLTPINIRRASYYLQLGVGTYFPNHPHFDCVKVRNLYPLAQNENAPEQWSQGIIVEFFSNGHRVRWVEFGCRVTGGGGEPILQAVK